jgi:hypothetical protein
MFSGYVQKQYDPSFSSNSSSNSSPYTRIYCVLWGTMLLDYSSYDDLVANLTPRYASEIIGVSKLDESHLQGFIIVTLSGITHRFLTKSSEEAQEWMVNIRVGLECVFGNKEIFEYRPSKITYDYPPCQNNTICPLTSQFISSSSRRESSGPTPSSYPNTMCKSCGYIFLNTNQFYLCPVIHFNKTDEPLLLCTYCYHAQLLLYTLKQINYVNLFSLHEHSIEILLNPDGVYQATSTLRQWTYPSLSKVSEMNETKSKSSNHNTHNNSSAVMSSEENSTLQQIEMKYQFENFKFEYEQMRVALQTLGNNIQYIIDFLRNPILKSPSSSSSGSSFSTCSSPLFLLLLLLPLPTPPAPLSLHAPPPPPPAPPSMLLLLFLFLLLVQVLPEEVSLVPQRQHG